MAMLRFCTGMPVTSRPSNQIEPDVGASSPAISRIRLVLPESVGPSKTLSDPCCKVSDTSRICSAAPTTLVTFLNSSIMPPRLSALPCLLLPCASNVQHLEPPHQSPVADARPKTTGTCPSQACNQPSYVDGCPLARFRIAALLAISKFDLIISKL